MAPTPVCALLFLIGSVACIAAAADVINNDVVVVKALRTVDLTSHLPKISTRLTLENSGKTAVKSILFTIDPNLADNLSFIGASVRIGPCSYLILYINIALGI